MCTYVCVCVLYLAFLSIFSSMVFFLDRIVCWFILTELDTNSNRVVASSVKKTKTLNSKSVYLLTNRMSCKFRLYFQEHKQLQLHTLPYHIALIVTSETSSLLIKIAFSSYEFNYFAIVLFIKRPSKYLKNLIFPGTEMNNALI